nr:zinc finger, CCHC-type [Tanacetum cinerariifolium]
MTVREFHTSKQEEGQSVSSHVLKIKGYIDKLERLGQPVGQNLVVSLILVSLNKDFDSFVQNYNMHGMRKTVNKLHAMLKLHEETLPKKDDIPSLHAIRAGRVQKNQKNKPNKAAKGGHGKGKGKIGHALNNAPFALKPKTPPPLKKDNPAKDAICHQCAVEAIGTYHLELPSGLVIVLNNCHYAPFITRGVISVSRYPKETIGYSFYSPSKNKVFVARNVEFFESKLLDLKASGSVEDHELIQEEHTNPSVDTSLNHEEDDQEFDEPQSDINPIRKSSRTRRAPDHLKASGSVEDHELIQEEDTNPSVDTSLNHEEDDQEFDEPQSDINPIRKSSRTRRAPDRMCLYIDAEEHELGNLGEPANYKAALLDPESKKCKWLFKKKTDTDGAVYIFKARLVAKGFTQTYMVVYEETFSPVADIRAIRILIAIATYYDYEIWQMDVKTTFLNGHLSEEVYMEQPEGFVNPKYPNHACKLKHSIYGLKQASRQWNK